MPQVEHYEKEVASVPAGATCREMAEKMKADATGCLVVLDSGRPVGMVTDRDLLCRVIGEGRDAGTVVARDVMSEPLVSATPEDPLERIVDAMSAQSIRRVPVLRDGELVGIVSLDDLLVGLSEELRDVADGARRGIRAAQRRAQAVHLAQELEERVRDWGEELERLGGETGRKLLGQLEALRDRLRGRES